MPCMKRVYIDKRRRYIGLQPGMKSGRRPADKPLINRGSTTGFVPPTAYMGIPLFVLPKKCSGHLSSMPWRARGTVVSCAKQPVGVPSRWARPAKPPRRAPLDPTRPWCVRVLDSTSYVDGVELVAVQDEGFARALCLNSEEIREEVGRVEVRGCGLFGFRKGFFFFGFLFVILDRGKVRKLKLMVEGEVRGRVGRVGRARVAQVERDTLPLEAHPPAGRSFCGARVASACGCLEPRGAVKVRLRSRI